MFKLFSSVSIAILALNDDAVKLSSGALPDYDRDNPNVQEAIRFWNENFGDEYYVTCTTLKEKLEDDDDDCFYDLNDNGWVN